METPKPRNCYSPRTQVLSPPGHTPAQQQFKSDCDINTIMDRVTKGLAVDHHAKHQLNYGVTNPNSYHKSMNIITTADSMFNDLPSKIRNEFHNNPQEFLKFVQDPKNADHANELGLSLSPEATKQAKEIKITEAKAASNAEASGDNVEDESPQETKPFP